MVNKIFGGIRMTWKTLILFAVISGVITGIIAQWVPEGNSFRQIAVTFEAWIVLAIVIVVNCERPLEAACKTFVYFLISQPLVYLVQVPFNSLGFGLFSYYYPYWFYWTLATFPGAFIAWYIKRDDLLSALILSVALGALILIGCNYLRITISDFPRYLVATLFCFGMVPVLIIAILKKKQTRIVATVLASLTLAFGLFWFAFRAEPFRVGFGLETEKYPVTEGWTAELEDPENGKVTLTPPYDVFSPHLDVEIKDLNKPTGIILKDPEGNPYLVPLKITKDGGTISVTY